MKTSRFFSSSVCYISTLLVAMMLLAPQGRAKDPFAATVSVPYPPPYLSPTYGGGTSFTGLLRDIIVGSGAFSAFHDSSSFSYQGDISYLGMENAIFLGMDVMGGGSYVIANIAFGDGGVEFAPIDGSSREEVYEKVKDFILNSDFYKELMKKAAQESVVAISDGNPNSTTAQMANDAFQQEGFTDASDMMQSQSASGTVAQTSAARFSGLGFGMNTGEFRAGGFKGKFADFAVPFKNDLSDMVSLNFTLSFNYLDLEGARIYGFGVSAALPLRFAVMSKDKRVNWRFTPVLGAAARGSRDLESGGIVWTLGGVHTVDIRVNSKLIVSFVNQLSYFNSIAARIQTDHKFDPEVNQTIFKNGVRFVTPITRRVIGEAFVIRSDFMKNASIDNYMTYGGSISFRLTRRNNITIAGNYDYDNDYKAWSFGISSIWSF